MPLLDIPDLLHGPGKSLNVRCLLHLDDASLPSGKEAFGDYGKAESERGPEITRMSADVDGQRVTLVEHYGLYLIDPDDVQEVRRDMQLPEGGPEPRGVLFLNLEATVDKGEVEEKTDDAGVIARIWDWLAASSLRIDARVTAGLHYDRAAYSPVIPLPLEVPKDLVGFDSIEGVSLVKRQNGAESPILYEARLLLRKEHTSITVAFRSPIAGAPQALSEVLVRATEIGGFAMRSTTGAVSG